MKDQRLTSGSPPSYEAVSSRSWVVNESSKGGYVTVPVEEPPSSPLEDNNANSSTTDLQADLLGLTVQDGVYCGFNNEVRDNASLYDLISSQISAPQMYLRITGHPKHSSRSLLSFTVPLPKMQAAQGTLFSKADDCPSIRGSQGRTTLATELEMRLRGRSSMWSSLYSLEDGAQIRCTASEGTQAAPMNCIQHWNARRRRNLIPPWIALGDNLQGDRCETDPNSGLVRRAIHNYFKVDEFIWSRWLIVPQVSYGWDLGLIEAELNKKISRGFFSTSELDRVSVEMVNPAPSISIHMFPHPFMATFYKLRCLTHVEPRIWLFFVCIFALFSLLCLVVGSPHSLATRGSLIFIGLFGLAQAGLIYTSTLIVRESVDDSVGVAWAMKKWIKTEVSPSSSKEEALEEIRRAGSVEHPRKREESILQRRADGWYLLIGLQESEWLERYGKDIDLAMKQRVHGNLDHLFDSEYSLHLRQSSVRQDLSVQAQ